MLKQDVYKRQAQALLDCHRVFIHAKSASASLGQLLLFRLRRLGIEAILLPSGGSEVLEGLSQARSDDLVVLFSFSKVSREGRIDVYKRQALAIGLVVAAALAVIVLAVLKWKAGKDGTTAG